MPASIIHRTMAIARTPGGGASSPSSKGCSGCSVGMIEILRSVAARGAALVVERWCRVVRVRARARDLGGDDQQRKT
jgi:hypothetical protein